MTDDDYPTNLVAQRLIRRNVRSSGAWVLLTTNPAAVGAESIAPNHSGRGWFR